MYDAKLSRKVHWLGGLGRRGLSSGGGGRKKAWDVAGDLVYTIFFFFPPWVEPRKTKSSPIGPNLPAHPVLTSTYSHMNTDHIHDHRHDRLTSSVGPHLPNLRACLPAYGGYNLPCHSFVRADSYGPSVFLSCDAHCDLPQIAKKNAHPKPCRHVPRRNIETEFTATHCCSQTENLLTYLNLTMSSSWLVSLFPASLLLQSLCFHRLLMTD